MKQNRLLKKLFIVLFFTLFSNSLLVAYTSKAINAYGVAIYDKNMKKENIQGKSKTKNDYNGTVFVEIYAFGKFFEIEPNVRIGSSQGILIDEKPIVKNRIIIGYDMLFKFTTVQGGYLEVFIGDKLFSKSVYIR